MTLFPSLLLHFLFTLLWLNKWRYYTYIVSSKRTVGSLTASCSSKTIVDAFNLDQTSLLAQKKWSNLFLKTIVDKTLFFQPLLGFKFVKKRLTHNGWLMKRKMASVLHSTGEIVSTQMKSDLSTFNRLDDAAFQSLTDIIFDFLLASKQPDVLISRLEDLSAEVGLGLSALKTSVRSELALLRAAGKQGTTAKNLQEDFELLGLFNEINLYNPVCRHR